MTVFHWVMRRLFIDAEVLLAELLGWEKGYAAGYEAGYERAQIDTWAGVR